MPIARESQIRTNRTNSTSPTPLVLCIRFTQLLPIHTTPSGPLSQVDALAIPPIIRRPYGTVFEFNNINISPPFSPLSSPFYLHHHPFSGVWSRKAWTQHCPGHQLLPGLLLIDHTPRCCSANEITTSWACTAVTTFCSALQPTFHRSSHRSLQSLFQPLLRPVPPPLFQSSFQSTLWPASHQCSNQLSNPYQLLF